MITESLYLQSSICELRVLMLSLISRAAINEGLNAEPSYATLPCELQDVDKY